MKSINLMMKIFFPALLAACGQIPAGDFCDIAKPDLYATDEVATYMVKNDPDHVRADLAENEYGYKNCPNWSK